MLPAKRDKEEFPPVFLMLQSTFLNDLRKRFSFLLYKELRVTVKLDTSGPKFWWD